LNDAQNFRDAPFKSLSRVQLEEKNWYSILMEMSDHDLQTISGADCVLYLKFQKYTFYLFGLLSLLNCASLIPIYTTGNPKPSEADYLSDLGRLTVLNITDSKAKIWAVFSFIILNTVVTYVFLYKFWRLTQSFAHSRHSHDHSLTQKDVALHTIFVRGIPEGINPRTGAEELLLILKRTLCDQIIAVKIIGDDNEIGKLGTKWEKAKLNLEKYAGSNMRMHFEGGQRKRITKCTKCRCLAFLKCCSSRCCIN